MQYMVKKTLGGYVEAKNPEDATHVMMTLEEKHAERERTTRCIEDYGVALRERSQLLETERASRDGIIEAKYKEFAQKYDEAKASFEKKAETCQTRANQAEKELIAQKTENEVLKKQNENLLRICRERSNAARKLPNKKQHSGYAVLSSREFVYRWREVTEETRNKKKKEYEQKKAKLWETTIQTPWTSNMDISTVMEQTENDLLREQNLAKNLGLTGCEFVEAEVALESEGNWMFQMDMKNNYQRGYWEVVIRHTKPLGLVPEHMDVRKLPKENEPEKPEKPEKAEPKKVKKSEKKKEVTKKAPEKHQMDNFDLFELIGIDL